MVKFSPWHCAASTRRRTQQHRAPSLLTRTPRPPQSLNKHGLLTGPWRPRQAGPGPLGPSRVDWQSWALPEAPAPAPAVPLAGPSPVTLPGPSHPQVITIFNLVEVVLQAEATALKYSAVLKRPGTEGLLDPQDQLGCGNHKEEQD